MASSFNEKDLKKILQGIVIPPQPQILVDIQMEQVMPDPDMAYIASIISQDVSLSAAVLKFTNSSYFNLPAKITSIQQAVIRLGPDKIANIINGLLIKSELSDDSLNSLHSFWDTASDVARISASIADQLNFKFKDESYSLGLFHNAGIPLMMQRFDNYKEVLEQGYQSSGFTLTDLENKHFNTNHSVIGYYLAKSWGIPKINCSIISNHHRIEELFNHRIAGDNTYLTLASILKVSEHIASVFKHLGRASKDYEWEKISHYVLDHLDLSEYDLEGMIEICHEQGLGVL
ncbi:HDOD domain-containing protein [Marinomonas sp. C2222]|uniref:HDOD domain-containing protein n=1 Tax=Marinomonas sargassi TaxID=2984494 RepID=A0ABT2YU71_9GAMM|nr:HDOD domain-containing protein [Marinomonas sargassi]MCV2403444.1 HDOD domain-containing protein [Marinomonas sargassi]